MFFILSSPIYNSSNKPLPYLERTGYASTRPQGWDKIVVSPGASDLSCV